MSLYIHVVNPPNLYLKADSFFFLLKLTLNLYNYCCLFFVNKYKKLIY